MESRRSMNIGIFLKQFGKSNEEITKALLEGNEKWLSMFVNVTLVKLYY